MTELYRNLLLVLTNKFNEIILTLRKNIRTINKKNLDYTSSIDVGVSGFWNLLLEIVFTLYSIICLFVGVILTLVLAVLAYPVAGLFNYIKWFFFNIRNTSVEDAKTINEIKIIKTPNNQN